MRFENNYLIGVLLKLPFRDVFRETLLFLPGTFRDCGVFDLFMTSSLFLVEIYKKNNINCTAIPELVRGTGGMGPISRIVFVS